MPNETVERIVVMSSCFPVSKVALPIVLLGTVALLAQPTPKEDPLRRVWAMNTETIPKLNFERCAIRKPANGECWLLWCLRIRQKSKPDEAHNEGKNVN